MAGWRHAFKRLTKGPARTEQDAYRLANVQMIAATLAGSGPHRATAKTELGQKAVVNIAAEHLLSFLETRSGQDRHGQYLNRPAVDRIAGKPLKTRTIRDRVDEAISYAAGRLGIKIDGNDMHFAALELNGTGIAYFGDFCLVLLTDVVPDDTLVLFRNSYDLTVPPVVNRVYVSGDWSRTLRRAAATLRNWAGLWGHNASDMAVVKTLDPHPATVRRLTTGQVSEGVLNDEDYIEVVLGQTFRPVDLQEIRVPAADAAKEAQISGLLAHGPPPSATEIKWYGARRDVYRAAEREGIAIRTVTHSGRSRS